MYFSRPDSEVFSDTVAQSRLEMGARLAREAPVEADVVVPVPDSGLYGALGFSRAANTPIELGLIRNHYIGRTFIEPQQSIRHFGVKVKLNPVRELIAGKRIVLVDDSIVRGTTSRKIVNMVREAGATEVHVRITSPPTAFSCVYGIDTPTRAELIASDHSLEEIRRFHPGRQPGLPLPRGSARKRLGQPRLLLHGVLERRLPRSGREPRRAAGGALPASTRGRRLWRMTGADAYREAGVDLEAQDRALAGIGDLVQSTFTENVLSGLGAFGGLFAVPASVRDPVLVASADGVGTKLSVARMAGDFSTVGGDLVNHCVNDILVQGATPLFFLDYVGAGKLDGPAMRELVGSVARACIANRCALLGGETAEMPGFYQPGDYELVGFVVGVVERDRILDGSAVRSGDALIGLASAGLHTNGFSLARRAFFDLAGFDLASRLPGSERTVRDALLAPHLSYLSVLEPLLGDPRLHALAHITGGGLTDNLPRVLPQGLGAVIETDRWDVPGDFLAIQRLAGVGTAEMYRVFNMGVGMVLVVDPAGVGSLVRELEAAGGRAFVLGSVRPGEGVSYVGEMESA